MHLEPDIEVFFEFNGCRASAVYEGYRPAHLVREDYLTTGVHHYFEVDEVPSNGTAYGTITFISPEFYPNCLWINKKMSIHEGSKTVGYATVLKIMNPILDRDAKQFK